MKKSLAASLLLAAGVGVAHAQSSVTFYGIVDTGVEFYNHAATGGSFVGMSPLTGEVPSRFGLRGSEDLGGGLKAVFNLENGFAPSTGGLNYGGRLWGRMANVGLSNQYGTVLLGRQINMTYYVTGNADVIGPSMHSMANFDPYLANARSDNAIGYMGKFGGVTVGATYSFGRDAAGPAGPSATNCGGQVPGDFQACKQFTGMLAYDATNFGVAASYDQMRGGKGATAPLTSSAYKDTHTVVDGYYRFGPGRVGIGWIHRDVDAAAASLRSDIYFAGVNWLPTPAVSLDAQALHYDIHGTSNSTLIATRATYLLSKRTSVYALLGYMINSQKGASAVSAGGSVAPGENQTGAMLGIQHKF
ncbi:putative porin [Paraburkholderia sp. MM5482-R2]|uniref:porin n=1 Tax=Paraburkholderia sp. MM5482-R2 TaxID=2991064 RepID=UPI003D24FD09